MSTYWGYVCKNHEPPIESERWFNHGEETLEDVYRRERAGTWPDRIDNSAYVEPVAVSHHAYSTTAPIWWLRAHPNCVVKLRNEYGDEYAIEETQA